MQHTVWWRNLEILVLQEQFRAFLGVVTIFFFQDILFPNLIYFPYKIIQNFNLKKFIYPLNQTEYNTPFLHQIYQYAINRKC